MYLTDRIWRHAKQQNWDGNTKDKSRRGFGHGTATKRNPGQCFLLKFTKQADESFEDFSWLPDIEEGSNPAMSLEWFKGQYCKEQQKEIESWILWSQIDYFVFLVNHNGLFAELGLKNTICELHIHSN